MRDDLFKLPQDLVTIIDERFFMMHTAASNAIILHTTPRSSHVRAQRLRSQQQLEEVTFIVNAVHSPHVLCISTCNSAVKILDVTYV